MLSKIEMFPMHKSGSIDNRLSHASHCNAFALSACVGLSHATHCVRNGHKSRKVCGLRNYNKWFLCEPKITHVRDAARYCHCMYCLAMMAIMHFDMSNY